MRQHSKSSLHMHEMICLHSEPVNSEHWDDEVESDDFIHKVITALIFYSITDCWPHFGYNVQLRNHRNSR